MIVGCGPNVFIVVEEMSGIGICIAQAKADVEVYGLFLAPCLLSMVLLGVLQFGKVNVTSNHHF